MTSALALVTTLAPASLLMLAAWPMFGCGHPRELFDRYDDGSPALRCERCLRLRPSILASKPHYRLTQPGGSRTRTSSRFATGIERIAAELDHPISDRELFGLEARRS